MQIIDKTLELPLNSLSAITAFLRSEKEKYCFFDIETTGLSARISSLYLIGTLWYDPDDQSIHIRQWFADDYISEKEIITSFRHFLSIFTTVIHYNGSGFDIPYIEKKCAELELPSPFSSIKSLDIYSEIRRFKSLFDVPDLKLFTVEKLAGFMRKDILTGKDCIQTYSQFMQKKYFKDPAMEMEKQKLLLHNAEDIIGTFYAAQFLSYKCNFHFKFQKETENSAQMNFTAPSPFPFPVEYEFPLTHSRETNSASSIASVIFQDTDILLRIPFFTGTLRHYFGNYKDYFYLPAEDTAIHKSVGTYVDKEFREQAKASNCYIKKEAAFLPVPEKLRYEDLLFFRKDFKSKQNYILWEEKAKKDSFLMEEILHSLLNSL